MSNLLLKNLHSLFNKLKSSPPPLPTAPSSDCYFTSNPISLTPSSTADDDCCSSSTTSSAAGDTEYSISDDFTAVFASRRFFFASPGRSNSILDSSDACRRSIHGVDNVVSEGLKVPKISTDLYGDFRRSMQEMVEARELENDVRSDSEFLRELLSSYLRLNPKNTHKFIVKAFADLVLCLLASSSPPPPPTTLQKFVIFR